MRECDQVSVNNNGGGGGGGTAMRTASTRNNKQRPQLCGLFKL